MHQNVAESKNPSRKNLTLQIATDGKSISELPSPPPQAGFGVDDECNLPAVGVSAQLAGATTRALRSITASAALTWLVDGSETNAEICWTPWGLGNLRMRPASLMDSLGVEG